MSTAYCLTAKNLRTARRIHREREGAPTAGDRWFSLYLIGFVAAFYVLPIAYLIGDYLEPGVAARLTGDQAYPAVTSVVAFTTAAAMLLGRVQGPAYLTPFLAHTWLATPISRRRILLRPVTISIISVAAAITAVVGIGVFAMTLTGVWSWAHSGFVVIAVFCMAMLWGVLALLGQRIDEGWAGVAGILLTVGHFPVWWPATGAVLPTGLFASVWTDQALLLLPLAALTLTAFILVIAVPTVLEGIPGSRVINQSQRLSDARLFTSTGNLNDAAELFRLAPQHRLSGLAVGGIFAWSTGGRQDFVSAVRNPFPTGIAAVCISAGAWILASTMDTVGADFDESQLIITVPQALLGGLLIFFGTRGLAEGLRQVKSEFDAAPLYGWAPYLQLSRRVPGPLLATSILAAIGTGGAVAFNQVATEEAIWALLLTGGIFTARFLQSMRSRDIPVEMLAPTVIPGGVDLSALKILAWLSDGLLVTSTLILAAVVLPWDTAGIGVSIATIILTAVLWAWFRTGQRLFTRSPHTISRSPRA